MKNVFITGGAGYIGTALTAELLKRGYRVKCLDRLFFGKDKVADFLPHPNYTLLNADTRTFNESELDGMDVVIDMAALSNDPLGELVKDKTDEINHKARLRTNKLVARAGVKQYILASSCSVYGANDNICTETTPSNPASNYAVSNAKAERVLDNATDDFAVTVLRLATVFGISRRMRFDLAVNVMTLRAFKEGKIIVMGQGLQWRPFVHIQDVISAFIAVMEADPSLIKGQIFNVGSNNNNRRVINLAYMVREALPFEITISIAPDDPDARNYRVNFDKLSQTLNFQADYDIEFGIREIYDGLKTGLIWDFPDTVTVKWYKYLIEANEFLKHIACNGEVL